MRKKPTPPAPQDTMSPSGAGPQNPLYARALAAVPGMAQVETARQLLQQRREAREEHAPSLRRDYVTDICDEIGPGLLLDGELPADIGDRAYERSIAYPRWEAEVRVLTRLRQWLGAQADERIAEGIEAGLDVLRDELAQILAAAGPAVATLGAVRTAEDAVDAGNGAAEALRTVRQLADRYRTLRETQHALANAATTVSEEARPFQPGDRRQDRRGRWAGDSNDRHSRTVTEAVREFGRYDSAGPIHETDDPIQLMVNLTDPDRPQPEVAALDTVRRRVEEHAAAARRRDRARHEVRERLEQHESPVPVGGRSRRSDSRRAEG